MSSSSRASISQYSGMPALWYADISHSVSLSSVFGLMIFLSAHRHADVPIARVATHEGDEDQEAVVV